MGKVRQKMHGKDVFSRIPNGAPGLETRMTVIYDGGVRTGRISINRFVELTATAPAKLFGLFPQKGTIAVGSDADVVLFDPQAEHVISAHTHHSHCDYSLFEGHHVHGKVRKVFSRGDLIVDGDQWHGTPGRGRFLRRGEVGGY